VATVEVLTCRSLSSTPSGSGSSSSSAVTSPLPPDGGLWWAVVRPVR
jgi:hypothetical protein